MKKQFKLGVIGCGFMASAILKGVADSEFLRAKKIIVSDTNEEKLNSINSELGVNVTNDNRFVGCKAAEFRRGCRAFKGRLSRKGNKHNGGRKEIRH